MLKHMYILFSASLCLATVLFFNPAVGQVSETPVCKHVAADVDGDGFGWEYLHSFGNESGFGTCIVSAETTQKPDIINLETASSVELVRAYWDPNKDIADRNIRCDSYAYNSDSARYEITPRETDVLAIDGWQYSNLYHHRPLFNLAPYFGTLRQLPIDEQNPPDGSTQIDPPFRPLREGYLEVWTVKNGIYYGISPLAENPYVEIVDEQGKDAVRIWGSPQPPRFSNYGPDNQRFHLCYSLDGQHFIPTGAESEPGESLIPASDITLQVSPPADASAIINRTTNLPVDLIDSEFSYNDYFAFKEFTCGGYRAPPDFDDNAYHLRADTVDSGLPFIDQDIFLPSENGAPVTIATRRVNNQGGELKYSTYNFDSEVLTAPAFSPWGNRLELFADGFRNWAPDGSSYSKCHVRKLTHLSDREFFDRRAFYTLPVTFDPNIDSCSFSSLAMYNGYDWLKKRPFPSCLPADDQFRPIFPYIDTQFSHQEVPADEECQNGEGVNCTTQPSDLPETSDSTEVSEPTSEEQQQTSSDNGSGESNSEETATMTEASSTDSNPTSGGGITDLIFLFGLFSVLVLPTRFVLIFHHQQKLPSPAHNLRSPTSQ